MVGEVLGKVLVKHLRLSLPSILIFLLGLVVVELVLCEPGHDVRDLAAEGLPLVLLIAEGWIPLQSKGIYFNNAMKKFTLYLSQCYIGKTLINFSEAYLAII